MSDYDGDGRVDLVVTQNGAETKLYHNVGARPGLRVSLQGPDGNKDAIGAVMRLKFSRQMGPAREVHAGSGYWSQDSAVQVLATPPSPLPLSHPMGEGRGESQIWVRWPGGKTTTNSVPEGAKEILVDRAGNLTLMR